MNEQNESSWLVKIIADAQATIPTRHLTNGELATALGPHVVRRTECGRHRYLCTKGHHVVANADDLMTCSAIIPWPGGEPCGAQLSHYDQDAELEVAEARVAELEAALNLVHASWYDRSDDAQSAAAIAVERALLDKGGEA